MSHTIQRLKRWTLLLHHYLGAALCVLCVMWFASGVVLMYSPFPEYSEARQLAGMEPFDCARCAPSLAQALAAMPNRDTTSTPRLGMLLGQPVWRFLATDHRWHRLRADALTLADSLSPDDARRVAARYAGLAPASARSARLMREPDQWTVEAVLRNQLPMYQVEFADAAGTQVYVSMAGGDVMVSSTRRQRTLAWFGAIPHWIYPRMLRVHVGAWLDVVIVLSGLGALLSLSGLIVGAWQFRYSRRTARPDRPFRRSPYRPWWLRWHHYLGLVFGVVTFTWLLSGLLSVDPFEWSPGDTASAEERQLLAGGALDGSRFTVSPAAAAASFGAGALRELRPRLVGGAPYWVGMDAAAGARVAAADGAAPVLDHGVPMQWLTTASTALAGTAHVSSATRLEAHDDYYRNELEKERPLPVLRVRLADAERSTYYLDPRAGTIAMKQVTRSRWERWLYTGLHDFDFAALTTRPTLWYVVVLSLSLGGLVLALSGLVVAWRWFAPQLGIRAAARR